MNIKNALNKNKLDIRLKVNLKAAIIIYNVSATNSNEPIVYVVPAPCATETNGLATCPTFNRTFINHGRPSDNKIASELAPIELAIPVPASPLRAIITPVIISGVQPPIAKTVKPKTDSGIPKVSP